MALFFTVHWRSLAARKLLLRLLDYSGLSTHMLARRIMKLGRRQRNSLMDPLLDVEWLCTGLPKKRSLLLMNLKSAEIRSEINTLGRYCTSTTRRDSITTEPS